MKTIQLGKLKIEAPLSSDTIAVLRGNKVVRVSLEELIGGGGELPTLAQVATTGEYSDLLNKPTIGDGLSEANFTVEEKEKLQGIEANANNFSLPNATSGQVLKYGDQGWEAGTVENTTYTATNGIKLEGTTFEAVFGSTANTITQGNDSRLSNSREWTASTVTQKEAEAGTSSTRRAWTAQRVRQAINAWWQLVTSELGRNLVQANNAQGARNSLELGTASTRDVGTSTDNVMQVGAFGLGAMGNTVNNSTDIRTLPSGFYEFATEHPQNPTGFGATLTVVRRTTGCATYQVGRSQGNRFYLASGTNQEELNWVELVHSGSFDPSRVLSVSGGTLEGKLNFAGSSTEQASYNVAQGVAPSSPVSGDMWFTGSALMLRIGTATRTMAHTASWSVMTEAEISAGTATTARFMSAQRFKYGVENWWNSSGNGNVLGVQDVRTLTDINPSASGNFVPTPEQILTRHVSSYFSSGLPGGGWRSSLVVKGWHGATYGVWQLIGNSSTSAAADADFYLQGGRGDIWGPSYKIHHSGNSYNKTEVDNLVAGATTGSKVWQSKETVTQLELNVYHKVKLATPRTLKLPANPSENDFVEVYATEGTFESTIIDRNGKTLMGLSEDMTIDRKLYGLRLEYLDNSWRIGL